MSLLPASPEESPGPAAIGIYIVDPAERGSVGSGSAASTPQPTDPATAALLDFGSKVLDKLKSWFTPRAPIVVDTSAYLDTRYSSIGPAGFSPRHMDGAARQHFQQELVNVVDVGSNFVPGVGQVRGIYEVISGRNAITGERLSTGERIIGGVLAAVPSYRNWDGSREESRGRETLR